jgi:Leucine-rich repeat (LRR) protein
MVERLAPERLRAAFTAAIALLGLSLIGCGKQPAVPAPVVLLDEAVPGTADEVLERIEALGGKYTLDQQGRVWALDFKRCPLNDGDLEIVRSMPAIRTMTLRGIATVHGKLSSKGLKPLESLKELRRLDLSVNRFNGALEGITALPHLEYLDLEGTYFGDEAVAAIQSLPRLESLEVNQAKFSGKAIAALAQIRTLKTLKVGFLSATGRLTPVELKAVCSSSIEELEYYFDSQKDDLAVLGGLKHLRKWFSGFESIPVNRLAAFAGVDRLESIRAKFDGSDCPPEAAAALRSMKGLARVSIHGKGVCPLPILAALESLPRLEELELSGVDDAALSHLPALQALKKLDLSSSPAGSGAGLRPLPAMPALRELVLRADAVTPAGLEAVSRCPRLERLSFSLFATTEKAGHQYGLQTYRIVQHHVVGFKAHDLAPVFHHTPLKSLGLSDLGFGDDALAEVVAAQHLEELAISDSPVTDAGFVKLRSLEHLKAVEVSHTKVSYQAAEALYQARGEECAISDNWCCGCMAFTPRREVSDARETSRIRRVH